MYQIMKNVFYRKAVRRGISIVCLFLLCLCNPIFCIAEIEKLTDGILTFRVYKETGSDTSFLVVNGYDADKDSTGAVLIKPSYTDLINETRRVGGVDAEVFKDKTLASLDIQSDQSVFQYTIGRAAFSGARIGMSQTSETEDKCVIQGGMDTVIGPYAFMGAQIGGNLKIYATNGRIYASAFKDAEISGVLVISGTIDRLEEYVFSGTKAKHIELTNSVANIESRALADSDIMEFNMGTALKTLGSDVFEGCEHLEKIILPGHDCVEEAAEDAFPDNEGLTIVIPKGLTNLSVFHLEYYSHVVFQTAENLPADSPVIKYLKEKRLRYKEGENGTVNVPEATPTEQPTAEPTGTPTERPTAEPTETPTERPTAEPTGTPTERPTAEPTGTPTEQPTQLPTEPPVESPIPTVFSAETAKPVNKSKKTHIVKKIKYRIKDEHSVVAAGAATNQLRKLEIPDMVMIEGRLYKMVGIEKKAFRGQKKLKTVLVGNYVTAIGDEAFAKCAGLTKIQFGTGVKTLGKRVLYQDKKLKKIIFKGKRLKTIGKKTFSGVPLKVDIRADKTMVKKYAQMINRSKK